MITVIEGKEGMRRIFERTLPRFVSDITDMLFVNVDTVKDMKKGEFEKSITAHVVKGVPVIFYGDIPASVLLRRNDRIAPLLYRPNTAFFLWPVSFHAIEWICKQMAQKKTMCNSAMAMLAECMASRNEIGKFLPTIASGAYDPYGSNHIAMMRKIKAELGISGSIEKVCEELREVQSKGINPYLRKKMSGKTIPGIFCDIDVVGSQSGEVDPKKRAWLCEHNKPVVIWTRGDIEEKERSLCQEMICVFPFAEIRHFSGCAVEVAVGRLSYKEFRKIYNIQALTYIKL